MAEKTEKEKTEKKKAPPRSAVQNWPADDTALNESYKKSFRSLTVVVILQSMAVAGLAAALLAFMYMYKPQDRFYAVDPKERHVPMVALNQPNMTQAALLAWVSQASTEVMTFGFHDYREKLNHALRHFTPNGQKSFKTAMDRIKIIETIEKNQQIITAAPRSLPIIVREGPVKKDEGYFWHIQMPLIVTFQSGTRVRNSNMQVDLIVVRVPTRDHPAGIGIEQWMSRMGGGR